MKRAVSISIGSSKRNKIVEVELFGQPIRLERIGTDGDMEKAARLFGELDGQVDAFGVGGALLGLMIGEKWYTLSCVQPLVRYIQKTPVVDGTGLKSTLEYQSAALVEKCLTPSMPRRVLILSGVDRYGQAKSFIDAKYEYIMADLMSSLGLAIPIRKESTLRKVAAALIPVMGLLPFSMLYPTGEAQEKRTPRCESWFKWASVIAGDCHYITHFMPDDLEGKIIVTNTTTLEDIEIFRKAGVKWVITTTPVYDGRSFGTNVMEAGILAALNRKEKVDYAHPGTWFQDLENALIQLKIGPQIQEL